MTSIPITHLYSRELDTCVYSSKVVLSYMMSNPITPKHSYRTYVHFLALTILTKGFAILVYKYDTTYRYRYMQRIKGNQDMANRDNTWILSNGV